MENVSNGKLFLINFAAFYLADLEYREKSVELVALEAHLLLINFHRPSYCMYMAFIIAFLPRSFILLYFIEVTYRILNG